MKVIVLDYLVPIKDSHQNRGTKQEHAKSDAKTMWSHQWTCLQVTKSLPAQSEIVLGNTIYATGKQRILGMTIV
jgi:hypothetical protein